MKHTLSKFLSNRGSALFMVLSTMTALMISCMAMYFSVISSRSTQYAIFYQQQSYQTATSLSDAIFASMFSGKGGFETLTDKMWALNVGEKLSADTNGFSDFDSSGAGKEEDYQVGAYTLEITRLEDEKDSSGTTQRKYDIVVTASLNGSKQVLHNLISLEEPSNDTNLPSTDEVFAATGYVPNDAYLEGGRIVTDVFFDNESTMVNAFAHKSMVLCGNVSCGGSLTINYYLKLDPEYKTTFAVRDTFTTYSGTALDFYDGGGSSEIEKNKNRSVFMTGRDCNLYSSAGINNAIVYVLGDLNLTGYGAVNSKNTKFFVHGDVNVTGTNETISNIYCDGKLNVKSGSASGSFAGTWEDYAKGEDVNGVMTREEMINKLDGKTKTGIYYKWIVDSKNLDKDPKTFNYVVNPANREYTKYLAYSDTSRGCTIKDITMDVINVEHDIGLTLVIDTGLDPDNVYTIKLQGNRDYDGDGVKETFCWYPMDNKDKKSAFNDFGNIFFQILVMGNGSVAIDIPSGVTYQDDDRMKVMHYSWFALGGGTENYYGTAEDKLTTKGRIENTEYVFPNHGVIYEKDFADFVHRECKDGDGCTYTEVESEDECTECGNKLVDVVCSVHGTLGVYKYCPACYPDKSEHEGKCVNHVDRKAIDKFLSSHSSIKKQIENMHGGTFVYPNVNIFLISCDENASIRMSSKDNGVTEDPTNIIQNVFFGYIYAPYMTFRAGPSNTGGGMIRFMGGLTVSDYIIDDSYSILSCWPDKIPEELMSSESFKNVLTGVSKSWKISLNGSY